MDKKTRHRWVWKAAYPPVHFFCTRLRCFSSRFVSAGFSRTALSTSSSLQRSIGGALR